jgi:hypothetical protein
MKKSLEETIRAVSNKYRNRPSPLSGINPAVPFAPQQVTPTTTPSSKNIKNALIGDFKPPRDTFR